MLPYRIYLDRHDVSDDHRNASQLRAAFESYHDAEAYAKQLVAAWLDCDVPVLVRIAGTGGNLRFFPLRTTAEEYGVAPVPHPVENAREPQEGSMK